MKQALRDGMRRLAAGVCVVSVQVDGRRYAMTVSSTTSVSDDPASLLFCANRGSSLQPLLIMGQPFVVNILAYSQKDISNLCASPENTADRFSIGQWLQSEEGQPYLADAQANFFCHVDNDGYFYGTHQIVVGRVDRVSISDADIEPLIYVDGDYQAIHHS